MDTVIPHAPETNAAAVSPLDNLTTAAAQSFGYLQCHNLATKRIFGYVHNAYNSHGEYMGVNTSSIPSDARGGGFGTRCRGAVELWGSGTLSFLSNEIWGNLIDKNMAV